MRIKGLDFLRGFAIVLVIFRHSSIDNPVQKIGWVGVDLFFVLSGFLISGLLFKEYQQNSKIDFKKFLIRRALKILPAFYFFIATTIFLRYFYFHSFYNTDQIISELFFLQSYQEGFWIHTWSIAVEVHFYIALVIFLFWITKTNIIKNTKLIISILLGFIFMVFVLRFNISFQNIHFNRFGFTQTHLKIDGVLVGLLFSYLYYFTNFYQYFLRKKYCFLSLTFILICPVLIFPSGTFMMNAFGLSFINFGFGLLVLFSITDFDFYEYQLLKYVFLLFGFIGLNSYSIYLWHLYADNIVEFLGYCKNDFFFVLTTAILLGIMMNYLIEKPSLKLRSKFFKT